MRIIFLCLVLALLQGCSTIKSLLSDPREFDPVEYGIAIDTTVNTTRAIHLCDDPSLQNVEFWGHVVDMNRNSLRLDEYLANKKESAALKTTVDHVRLMVNDVLIRGRFSEGYCRLKLSNIQASLRIVSRTLGATDQFNMCEGGIRQRYMLFDEAYKSTDPVKKITAQEYKDLFVDLERLSEVDTSGCDMTTRRAQQEDIQLIEKVLPEVMSL